MFDKHMIWHFFWGFFSVFRLGIIPKQKSKDYGITECFCETEQDLLLAYEELRKTYERN